jgi:hypothetical protein
MSFAETIARKALQLVLAPSVVVKENARPDCLKNPQTGRNLELDFYLPDFKIGIEVQGQHHYEDENQVARDRLKRKLAAAVGIYIIEISIFQVTPTVLRNKLEGASKEQGLRIGLNDFHPSWLVFKKEVVDPYRDVIRSTYGSSAECQQAPAVIARIALKKEMLHKLKSALYVVVEHKGERLRAKALEVVGDSLKVRLLGSSELLYFKLKKILEVI